MGERTASIDRKTKETEIAIRLGLDGQGRVLVETGFGFFDHMLTLLGFWAGFDLEVRAKGDVHIDAHHLVEDVGLALGKALAAALGDKAGIGRVGFGKVPMDEAIAEVNIDLSGRAYLVHRGDDLLPAVVAGEERDLWREFFKSLAAEARMNLHIHFLYGSNGHHLLESAFKGLGLALAQAVKPRAGGVFSTKGSLDA